MIQLSPSQFGSDVNSIDSLYGLLSDIIPEQYTFNLENAGFVKPMGIMSLVLASRRIAEQSGYPVRLTNLDDMLLKYLERVNFFEVAKNWIELDRELPEERWERNPQTSSLLELTPITNEIDVALAMERADSIFSRWLQLPNLGSLLKVISELCSNIYQHSGDSHGFIMIQHYEYISRGEVGVILAAGDMGQGIRGSLATKYPKLGADSIKAIQATFDGITSRDTGRGGLGLPTVEETVAKEGGYVWLRSETAAIRSLGPSRHFPYSDLAYIPGTQVVVELHAPFKD